MAIGIPQIISAQDNNENLFIRLIGNCLSKENISPASVQGYTFPRIDSLISTDKVSSGKLIISEPEIRFKRVSKGMYSRFMAVNLISGDSTDRVEFYPEITDTIPRNFIKIARKTEQKPLRGESPLIFRSVILPALGIAVGISVIVILFTVRN